MANNHDRHQRVLQGWLLATASLVATLCQALPDVQVNGLLPNQAVVTIDGQQHILKVGKTSPEGVTLVSADSHKAIFSWEDQQFERQLSQQIASKFSEPARKEEARIERGDNGHFFTPGHINGKLVNFMVDTGAFTIAMSPDEADRLGLDWRQGERFTSNTASGAAPAYFITLKTVTIDGLTLHNIRSAVIVGDPMPYILLGMSFLEQTEMREENSTLILRKKY